MAPTASIEMHPSAEILCVEGAECRCVCNLLRRSCVSEAGIAGDVACLGERVQPSAAIVRVEGTACG